MINKILRKYSGSTNYWYPEVKEDTIYDSHEQKIKYSKGCWELEQQLLTKWEAFIPKGWYGFSLGEPCPHNWYKIIDDFLEYLKELVKSKRIQRLEIHQIKMKFGGLRFYIGYICEDDELREHIELQIEKLENQLFDKKLIY